MGRRLGRVFAAIDALKPEDVTRTVTIRGEPHTVLQAINRQIAHYAQHIGQMVFLAKHLRSSEWKTLSIPRGKSEDYKKVAKPKRRRQQRAGQPLGTVRSSVVRWAYRQLNLLHRLHGARIKCFVSESEFIR